MKLVIAIMLIVGCLILVGVALTRPLYTYWVVYDAENAVKGNSEFFLSRKIRNWDDIQELATILSARNKSKVIILNYKLLYKERRFRWRNPESCLQKGTDKEILK